MHESAEHGLLAKGRIERNSGNLLHVSKSTEARDFLKEGIEVTRKFKFVSYTKPIPKPIIFFTTLKIVYRRAICPRENLSNKHI